MPARDGVPSERRSLTVSAAALGSIAFMEQALSPLLHELGERWAQGALGVRHEHFAAECVREFLAQRWRPLSDAAQEADDLALLKLPDALVAGAIPAELGNP